MTQPPSQSTTDAEVAVDIDKLRRLVRRLRAPDGCPWDRKQTLVDLRAYLLEEAHEVAAAIDATVETGDWDDLADELGDLLFQVVFVSELASEGGAFSLQTVVDAIHGKMIERHPHVFGSDEGAKSLSGEPLPDAAAVARSWEQGKAARRQQSGDEGSVLGGVAATLPALNAAYRLTQKAAGVGFDWSSPQEVMEKVKEEIVEVEECLDEDTLSRPKVREEIGDLLFAVANLARHLDIDPEAALAQGNRKFIRRFAGVERGLAAAGKSLVEADLDDMEAQWQKVKDEEARLGRDALKT